jgi:glycosyltransferase involved in cell wall biosynthesis
MKFAIDLLWVRHNKVGGTESYVRNLLKGFTLLDYNFQIFLLLSEDNHDSFEAYFQDSRFVKIICNIKSENVIQRIIWENLNLSKILKKNDLNICFIPVYSKPFLISKKIKVVTTIHDLQALHYPKYQSKLRVLWLKLSWKNAIKTSNKVIAISEFVREDIIKRYNIADKVTTIYNPIQINLNDTVPFNEISEKYNIKENEYYYTVSSLAPHKNLMTLIKVINSIKKRNIDLPSKLLISGVGGNGKSDLLKYIQENNLEDNIRLTGFINDSERNTLYKYCKTFLFSSIFEGFGMPVIEAMVFNGQVITTKMTSIFEITQEKATYVDNPYDVNEWIDTMIKFVKTESKIKLDEYDLTYIAKKYLDCFSGL